jgi:hypothetical protein
MHKTDTFDWATAIEKNRIGLSRVLVEIFALLGLVAGGSLGFIPQALFFACCVQQNLRFVD